MEEVPQINSKNGLSYDYNNEYQSILSCIELYEKGIISYANLCNETKKIKTYTERYPPQDYKDVVNEKNREGINKINIIAHNIRTVSDSINIKEAVVSQLEKLIEEGSNTISNSNRR